MISTTLKMEEFLTAVALYGFQEIILKANQEATEVDRKFYKCRSSSGAKQAELCVYSSALKDFIVFMRYGVKTRALKHLDLSSFQPARREN